jgi:hypothetical protein
MPDAPVSPLLVYPFLWAESHAQHPHDWQWPDQLRCLCRLARDFRRANRAEVMACGKGERLFLQALDQVDVEDMIATLKSDFPHELNPMLRIDPFAPCVEQPDQPSPIMPMNGKRCHA